MHAPVRARIIEGVHLRPPRRLALLAAATIACATACGPAVDYTAPVGVEVAAPPGLAEPGALTVAVPSDLPPYAYRTGSGSAGLDVDLAQVMAQRMGLRLRVVALDPQDLPAAARGAGVDVVLGSLELSRTAPPPPDLSLVPYVKDQSVLLVTPSSGFQPRSLEELCGQTVAVVAGTAQASLLDEAVSICGQAPPGAVTVATDTAALDALTHQRASAYLADSATAAFDIARRGDVMDTGVQLGDTELAMGMRTGGTPLTDAVTRAFYLVHSDGTYELLLQKWGMSAETL